MTRSTPSRSLVALASTALFVLAAGPLPACKDRGVVPRADLSETLPAQASFDDILDRWEHTEWSAVLALEPRLDKHIKKHPKDPSAKPARAMRALIALEKGRLPFASSEARALDVPDTEGTTLDIARVVRGSIDRREGRPQRALEVLGKLFNKVIDAPTRAVLNRELVLAALGARKYELAAQYMKALLKQAGGPLRGFAENEVAPLVTRLPAGLLLGLLENESIAEEPDLWLSTLLTHRLAELVKSSQDPALARSLLDVAAKMLGEDADAVARVAARGAGVRLERNTVGLLMPLRSDELRRKGIEVATGLALALDIPGGRTKLVVRDDQREATKIDETFALLNADGAAVIVAGFDTREADLALAYAERTNVPMVLLRPPSRAVPEAGAVFVLGESPSQTRDALVRALVDRNKKRVALLVGERTIANLSPDVASAVVAEQPCGASMDFLKSSGATALVVDGGSACIEQAVKSAGGLSLGFGFDAARNDAHGGVFVTAGIFPLFGKTEIDPLLERYRLRERKDPTWWVGLGHDAGLIVKDAVEGLPTETDEAAAAVAVRKRIVTNAISKAEARLWTTEASGFAGARVIERTIGAIDRHGEKKPKR